MRSSASSAGCGPGTTSPWSRTRNSDECAKKIVAEIYRPLYLNQAPILFTQRRTAELIKCAANALLATKITFINEIADLCERVGADVQEIGARHRARQPHRVEVPACGTGLRRLLLPKRCPCADQDRAGSRRAMRILEAVETVKR
jgi:UDPglucose 6-dehydrogenase